MNPDNIIKREHNWDAENDRWILTTLSAHGVFGLNFMQGDDYETFRRDFSEPDPKLTAFYRVVVDNEIIDKGLPIMEEINRVCWAYLKLRINT